ncbi:hypothetical protein LUZ60_016117 [Juncus effusus]|nr:hypothetical protein LUZ60_016117 [Juncus effusus]
MAGGFVSSMIKWTAEKLSILIPEGAHGDGGLRDLQELQTTMQRIHAVLKDGDEWETILDHSERHRLKELKDVAYEADDVIDEYGYEVLRSQIEGLVIRAGNCRRKRKLEEAGGMSNQAGQLLCDPAALPVPDELSKRAREIRNKFEEIINCWEKLRWGESDGYRRVDLHCGIRPPSTSLIHKPDIHGRDKDRENVIKMLLSENRRRPSLVSVLPLTGMAGVGKTTLARLVYNDPKITEIVSLKGWVCVGGELDVRVVTRNILMSFTDQACDLTELQNLQRRLMEEVRGKRFFLVLDDVWNHNTIIWDSLKAPFVSAQSGTIIVTTYNAKGAQVMQTMQPYPVEPLSFNDSWSLFKQSAFQYEGSYAREELLEIGRNIVRKCGGLPLAVKAIGAALRLENDEDKWNDILKSDLWESDSMKGAILPALKLSYDRMPIHLKQCFIFCSLFPKEFVLLKDKIIRLWMSLGLLRPDCRKSIEEIGHDTFDDFTDCLLEELPESIGNLKQLRYLCLTNTGIDKLPESICNLYNLQTLELIMCPLKKLPHGIMKLITLRHLNFQQWFPICMPSGIGKLVNLNTLPRFHIGSDDWHCDISELNDLVNLRGELHISGLMNVSSIEYARKANLHNKQYLKVLRLDWCNETSSQMCCDHNGSSILRENHQFAEHHSNVLESLKPHPNLKVLEIFGFPGDTYPSWLDHGSFIKLVKISLNGSTDGDCKFLPALGRLPSLKTLSIKSMQNVRRVGHEFIGREFGSSDGPSKRFPSLETLDFDDMPSWTEWYGIESGDFGSLRELKIVDCPNLSFLPNISSTSLTKLEITDCNKLVVSFVPSIRSLTLKGKITEHIFLSTRMPSLRSLKVCHSRDIRSIELNKQSIKSLEVLVVHDCRNLATIVGFSDLKSLKLLKLSACRNLKFLLDESIPRTLWQLYISNCPNLPQWEQIQLKKYKNQLTGNQDARDEDLESLAKLSDDEEETFQRLREIALQ